MYTKAMEPTNGDHAMGSSKGHSSTRHKKVRHIRNTPPANIDGALAPEVGPTTIRVMWAPQPHKRSCRPPKR